MKCKYCLMKLSCNKNTTSTSIRKDFNKWKTQTTQNLTFHQKNIESWLLDLPNDPVSQLTDILDHNSCHSKCNEIYCLEISEKLFKLSNQKKKDDGSESHPNLPQWQKSDEITNKFCGSAKNWANNFPYWASFSVDREPTNIGTTVKLSR